MSFIDIHLQNILLKLPASFHQLSTEQLYENYGKPDATITSRRDGKPVAPNVSQEAVVPLYLGKMAHEFNLSDAGVVLSDFGEAFAPGSDLRRGRDCNTPLAF